MGAVNACTGAMRYFDTRQDRLCVEHVMASGALPPAFPAVRIDGEPYWDGGIYSNTPIEAVLDDKPRRDSLIFAVNVWHQTGPEPESIWQVMGRQKDIQYASRADSHIARQKQLHRLRHVIRELTKQLAGGSAVRPARAGTRLLGLQHDDARCAPAGAAPRRRGPYEGHRLHIRRCAHAARGRLRRTRLRMIERAPWRPRTDPIEGVIEHA